MQILYVAKHDQPNSNLDEVAIAKSLQELGHSVIPVEQETVLGPGDLPSPSSYDLLLFHKWSGFRVFEKIDRPKVFWFFDLIKCPSRGFTRMCRHREQWARNALTYSDLGFFTDGDYVNEKLCERNPISNKVRWLPQGFNSHSPHHRIHPESDLRHDPATQDYAYDVFIPASVVLAKERVEFIEALRATFGARLKHVTDSCHGAELARLVRNSRTVVAPNFPVTDRYWSNRVYLMTGLHACLLHPKSKGLEDQYRNGIDFMTYGSFSELVSKIYRVINDNDLRNLIAQSGYDTTMLGHTYTHRCRVMLEEIFKAFPNLT